MAGGISLDAEGLSLIPGSGGGGAPSGPAGGVLSGTYPNPGIAANLTLIGDTVLGTGGIRAPNAGGAGTGYAFGPNDNNEFYWNGSATFVFRQGGNKYMTFFRAADGNPAISFDDGNAWINYGGAVGFLELGKTTSATGVVTGTRLDLETVRTAPVALAALPTGVAGMVAAINDGTAALAWGATATDGGTDYYLVTFNGTNWTVIGK